MIYKKFIAMIPYETAHFDELIPSLRDRDMTNISVNGGIEELRSTLAWLSEFAILQTFMTYEKKVAAIFAFVQQGDGEMVIWAITGGEVDRLPKAFVQACKRLLPKISDCLDDPLKKISAFVHSDHKRSAAWLNVLGFVQDEESKVVNGEEYFCFAKDMRRVA